ncbi:MAG: hypothetical protein HQL95_01655 [Magnetococcales bacterium]|nr:hypothetical protein [Magnetococcales bacterium]
MKSIHTCRGAATLLASLFIMIILTLLVLSSANISTVNFRIVANLQTSRTMDSGTQQAMESVLSQAANFNASTATHAFTVGTDTGSVAAPVCIHSHVAEGSSAAWSMAPRDNTWELTATIANAATGAATTMHQAVKIRQLSGVCCPDC